MRGQRQINPLVGILYCVLTCHSLCNLKAWVFLRPLVSRVNYANLHVGRKNFPFHETYYVVVCITSGMVHVHSSLHVVHPYVPP